MDDFEPGTIGLLMRVMRPIKAHIDEDCVGLRLVEFIALAHLRDVGGIASQKTLSHDLCLDRNNLVLLLNDLEEDKLVVRTRDPEDRRRHFVELTADGRSALDVAERGVEGAAAESLLAGLSETERAQLDRLLRKVLEVRCSLSGAPGLAAAS